MKQWREKLRQKKMWKDDIDLVIEIKNKKLEIMVLQEACTQNF